MAIPALIIQEGSEVAEGSDGAEISSDGKVGRERSNEALVRSVRNLLHHLRLGRMRMAIVIVSLFLATRA